MVDNEKLDIHDDASTKKRRNGRPAGKNFPHVISTRLSDEDKALVDEHLARCGFNKAQALRLLLLSDLRNQKLPTRIPHGINVDSQKIYTYLAPMQSNLNQIARHLNANRTHKISTESLLTVQKTIKTTLEAVKQIRHAVFTHIKGAS